METKTLNDLKNIKSAREGSWLYEMFQDNNLDKYEKQKIIKKMLHEFKEKRLEEIRLLKERLKEKEGKNGKR